MPDWLRDQGVSCKVPVTFAEFVRGRITGVPEVWIPQQSSSFQLFVLSVAFFSYGVPYVLT